MGSKLFEITDLQVIPFGAEILVYGAGGMGAKLLELIGMERSDITVLAFVDTHKHGGTHCKRKIVNIDDLMKEYPEKSIVIASLYYKEIASELQQRGITDFYIYRNYGDNEEYYDSLCKVALNVESGRIRTLEKQSDAVRCSDASFVCNLPVQAEYAEKIQALDDRTNQACATTSILDGSFDKVANSFDLNAADEIVVLDAEGDQEHLVKLLSHLAENSPASISVWKKRSNIRSVVSIDQCALTYLPIPKCGSSSLIYLLRSLFESNFKKKKHEHRVQNAESLLFHADVTSDRFRGHDFFRFISQFRGMQL